MPIPGEGVAKRPLHFIWLADTSYSMEGDKIESLNHAIRDSLPLMRNQQRDHSDVNLLVRAIKFSDNASWIVEDAVPVDDFEWHDLEVEGLTAMGGALKLLADSFHKMESGRGLRPVVVLVTDGYATDNFEEGLEALNNTKWGKVAIKIAIGIGSSVDEDALMKFAGSDGQYIPVNNSAQLIDAIKWASSVVVKSSVVNKEGEEKQGIEYIPDPEVIAPADDEDDWDDDWN